MIFFETANQSRVFLLLLYAGFGAALLYDLTRLLRRISPRWIGPVWDVLWCLAVGLACALALAAGGEHRLRLYALLGLCCGAGVYCLGAGTLLRALRPRAKRDKGAGNRQE